MKIPIIYSEDSRKYDFGEGHPFRSSRFENFLKLYEEKLAGSKDFELVENNELASDEELKLWHTKDYIHVMKSVSGGLIVPDLYRYVSQDNLNPATGFPKGIEKASRAVVKNSILAVDYVQQGKSEKAVNIGGGLHHAKSSYGEGFCVYNDVVIAVKHAMEKYGLEKILVLDTDAHAGNGTCEAFYSEPRVLFIDLHQRGIYPGTGFIDEIGSGKGKSFTVNLPLSGGTGNKSYELIFERIIFPLAQEYEPQLIIRYGGSDPHFEDGLTGLGLTLNGFKMIGGKVRELSKLCENKSVDLICSGYNLNVLARAWLSLIAGLAGIDIEIEEDKNFEDAMLNETSSLISEAKEILNPYWKSMR